MVVPGIVVAKRIILRNWKSDIIPDGKVRLWKCVTYLFHANQKMKGYALLGIDFKIFYNIFHWIIISYYTLFFVS